MKRTTLARSVVLAACGTGVFSLALPAAALAATASDGPSLTASQQRQVDALNKTTTARLVAQASRLTGGADPKAAPGHAGPLTRSGTYPTRKGTFLSTDSKLSGLIPTGHSAMVYSAGYVVESNSNGVIWGANDWYATRTHAWGMTTRATTSTQDANAANWATGQLGKPYNYNYFDMGTRSRFYCSQLV